MKQLLVLVSAFLLFACDRAPQDVSNTNSTANQPLRAEKLQSTTEHTTENQPPKSANSSTSKWSQSGEPIDTAKFDDAIGAAEKALKAKPSDEAANKNLAEAFFARGFALTEARQYASALGDYRRALTFDPNHEESKKWIDQIILIYGTLKKDYPKEGEEPPPLPLKEKLG